MLNWQYTQIKLDLKYTWKLSRNATDFKINTLIEVGDGTFKGLGEVAPNIRYNETPELVITQFEHFLKRSPEHISNLNELTLLLDEANPCNALRFGIESAYIHYLCNKNGEDVCTFLGIQKPVSLQTSFSLPIMPAEEIASFYQRNNLERFSRLKIKVNAEQAHSLLKAISDNTSQPLIVDANEGWKNPEELLVFLETLKPYPIDIIEQPMPAGMIAEYQHVKKHSPFTLIADESMCHEADFEELKKQFHGVNMKLMKAGGYINGLRLLNEAVKHQMHTMVGCMIETTLGISSAMHLCSGAEYTDLDGFMIIKDEPFNLVKEQNGLLTFN